MVQIRFSDIVGDARGSVGGSTYARNHYGAYVRNRTTPINPQSARQTAIRVIMQQLTAKWRDILTEAQRTAWRLYGDNTTWLNSLGEQTTLPGFNHYLRSNLALANAGLAAVDDGPTTFGLPQGDPAFAVSADEASQNIAVVFDDALPWCDIDEAGMIVHMGTPQNQTINFFNGPWRFGDSIDGDSVTPPSTPEDITAPFVVSEDQKIWCKAAIILEDGRLSQPFRSDAVVTAA